MQKPWSEIERGDYARRGDQEIRVLEVGASGNTFLGCSMNKDDEVGNWHDVDFLKKWGWTLHGEPEKWEPSINFPYWYVTVDGVGKCERWMNDASDLKRRNGLGIHPTRESAQAMFEKLKKVARGE